MDQSKTSAPAAGPDAQAPAVPEPTKEQLQFARAVYIIFHLWPAMRHAVAEAWGGPESREKMEYLLSYICDEYGNGGANTKPDMDDLADLMEDYIAEEYECRLEDDSASWAGAHIVNLHERIFSKGDGDAAIAELEASFARLGSKKPDIQMQEQNGDDDDDDDDESAEEQCTHDHSHDHTHAHASTQPARARAPRPEPEIDEDGFQTVAPRRRR
ncbi:rRNA accumulation- protein [Malassezia cuniculi]|uniref:rRNA accumulation- protein n=1 Tax=Malassezia cuniculi TaxID=948313 RepID=A0AAF0J4X1_9BASI|nr:rRNA accumulation- protein [Malassezia cuniculi]